MRTAEPGRNQWLVDALTAEGRIPLPFDIHKGAGTLAYLNHGRWVADCPECNGAEIVAPSQTMLCGSCGAEHEVSFPRNREKIEAVLNERTPPNRNWYPAETVDELVAQNIEHGLFPEDY